MEFDNGRLDFAARIDTSQLKADAQKSKDILKGIGSTAVQEGNQIEAAMGKIGRSVAAVFAVSKLKDFATQVATVRGEFQQLEIAFQTMLGSKTEADNLMSQLIQTAATTPFGMSDVANSAKQLLAYGVAADEVNDTLIRLGDIAAGLSIPINDLAYLYGTTMVQGRLYTQDLNQFLGRGIPLSEELAKQFGVTTAEIKDLVTAGKVGFPEVKEAIISLTSEGGKFGGLMAAQSKTITGQISNIEDSIEQMFNELGKSSEGIIGTTLDVVSSVVEHWKEIGKVLLIVISAYGTYKAAVIAVNAIQKINNTLNAHAAVQMSLVAMQGHKLSEAQAMAAARTALLTNAWNGLKVAMAVNPVGAVLAVFAAAATAIGLFTSKTTELTTMSEKFGESAAKQIVRLNTLTTTYKGLTEGTATHKKTLEELNKILEEYGIAQIKEGDNIDVVNTKREQAIELIKQEAIERQRANMIDTALEDYFKGLEAAQKNLTENIQDVAADKGFTGLRSVVAVRNNAEAISNIIAQHIQENISLIAGKTGEEYEKGLDKIYSGLEEKLRKANLAEASGVRDWVSGFWSSNVLEGYIDDLIELNETKERSIDTTNRYADAEKEAAQSSATFSDKVAATQRSLKGASNDVHTLYKNIKNLMSKYKQNKIGFTIDFNAKIPSWMTKMKLPRLQELAAQFTAIGDQLLKSNQKGKKVNGKYMTTQQILQRGADYANAAEQKQTEADEAKKQKEADAKDKKSKADAAKRQKEEDAKRLQEEEKRIKEQIAERKKTIEEYAESVKEQNKQAELDIEQKTIENLEDGYEKQRKQVELNYKRLKAENEKRAEEMIEALADNKLNEWLNENPKATKEQQAEYYKSLFDEESPNYLNREHLTKDQQDTLNAYDLVIEENHAKQLKDLYQGLLDDYQDYETRRTEIQKKYEKQRKALESIENADDATKSVLIEGWDNMSADQRTKAWDEYVARTKVSITELGRQEKEEIKSVNNEEIEAIQKSSTLLVDLFSDAADKSDKEIRKITDDAQALVDYLRTTKAEDITPNFGFTAEQLKSLQNSPEKLKDIADKLKELKETARESNPFRSLASDIEALFAKPKEGDEKKSVEARLKKLGASASECADVVGGLAGNLSEMFSAAGADSMAEAMEGIQDVMSSVSNIGKGFAQGGVFGGISAAAGEAINYVTKALEASARHAAALKEIMKEITAQQRAYNLALLDESLAMEEAVTVFGTIDYAKASNAVNVMRDAWADLRKEIEGTADKQKYALDAFSGTFKAYNTAYTAAKAAYSGLASIQIKVGHKTSGLFGWGSGKDIYSSILGEYPELIDSQGKFNTELAKSIIETRTFNGTGKETLQYMIDLAEEAEKAFQTVKDFLTDIFGELGNTMSDALVDAFANGTDAAEAFGQSVTEMLESLGKQMIFSAMFGQIVEEANNEMLDTMSNVSLTEEQKFGKYIEILDTMTSGILGQQDNYEDLLEKYQKLAEAKGISLWQSDDESSREASSKGIASASQESIDELNGRITAIQGHTYNLNENTKLLVQTSNLILRSVQNIDKNTEDIPQRLSSMESNIKSVKDTVNDIALKGIKIKA